LAFDEPLWLDLAEANMQLLLSVFRKNGEIEWLHTFKLGEAKFPAFLDDLAYLVQALITLYEPTGKLIYLEKARAIIDYLQANYIDKDGLFFYYTHAHQTDIMVRKKDIYDGAMPSGNALMAWNLYKASILLGNATWKQQSIKMLEAVKEGVLKYPNSFGVWAGLLLEMVQGTHEILGLGPNAKEDGSELFKAYIPNKVVMLSTEIIEDYPLMQHKVLGQLTSFYVCRNYTCQLPIYKLDELLSAVLTKP
jgi:hypothetical protein